MVCFRWKNIFIHTYITITKFIGIWYFQIKLEKELYIHKKHMNHGTTSYRQEMTFHALDCKGNIKATGQKATFLRSNEITLSTKRSYIRVLFASPKIMTTLIFSNCTSEWQKCSLANQWKFHHTSSLSTMEILVRCQHVFDINLMYAIANTGGM